MRRLAFLLPVVVLVPAVALWARPSPEGSNPLSEPQRRLIAARQLSAAAAARAAQLDVAASAESDGARRASAEEAAIAARVQGAEADLAAANVRIAILGGLLAQQRARLAVQQGPVVRLVAALQSFARRPMIVAALEPGSIDDLVHVRAVLGTVQPAIAARTAGVRAELDRARLLRNDAALAAAALAEGRTRLEDLRLQLVRLEAAHQLPGRARQALVESDRAIALGERARDLADQISAIGDSGEVRTSLETLPEPLPRPPRAGESAGGVGAVLWSHAAPPYRLPVSGRLVTGLGELSAAGVRSRGLSFAVAPGAPVIAPAAGRIAFAGPFRDYGLVVIIDHGNGWTTLLAGLGSLSASAGAHVAQGEAIGRAGRGGSSRVTVELRRRGRPIDITPLAG